MSPSSSNSNNDYSLLLQSAKHLCTLFSNPHIPPTDLLALFTADAICHEHATARLNSQIPFLARDLFPNEYFQLLGKLMSFQNMVFDEHEFWVDERKGVVGARGRARFTWIGDGDDENEGETREKSWDEIFVYRLEFAEAVEEVEVGRRKLKVRKVKKYEIWGDTGAMERAAKA
ncbi:hypothetical protein EX30DRAFT_338488, partial [Ascodesmis nigricans]